LSTVFERVAEIVVDKLGVDAADVKEGSSFQDDLGADSLDLVELIMAFEEEFSSDGNAIEIPDEDAGEIHTIADAVTYLQGKGAQDE
jgi:acyl carrier protein